MRALISIDLDLPRKYAARVYIKYTCSRIFIQCDDEHVNVPLVMPNTLATLDKKYSDPYSTLKIKNIPLIVFQQNYLEKRNF